MKRTLWRTALLIPAAMLAGCGGNITGLIGAQEDFGCPASGGVNCTTVSATYEREHSEEKKEAATLIAPGTQASVNDAEKKANVMEDPRIRTQISAAAVDVPHRPAVKDNPIARAPERLVMLWVLSWVDDAGDLHSDARVWMRVKDAAWRIESVRTRAMQKAPESAP